ncbi:IS66 family transposase, partial [Sinorhizobium meliloti]
YALNHWNGLAAFLEDGRIEADSNVVERSMKSVGGPESLRTPSLSICKHWKRLRVGDATRARLSGYRGLDRRRSQVAGPDLVRRAGNHLLSRQHLRLDQVAYPMVGNAQGRRSLCHGHPLAVLVC